MWAVRNAHLDMAEWLRSHGARVDAVTKTGTNLLHWAIWSGEIAAVEWVLRCGWCGVRTPPPLPEPTKAQQAQPTIGALYCYAVLCYFATPYPERRSAFISVVRVLCVLSAAWAVVGWLATYLPCLPACLASAPLHLRSLAVDYKNEFGCSAAHWSATQVMRARVLICDCSPRTPQIRIPDGLHRNNT